MYRVCYTEGSQTAFFREFETLVQACAFATEQKHVIEIKYYDTKTNNIQDESHNFG